MSQFSASQVTVMSDERYTEEKMIKRWDRVKGGNYCPRFPQIATTISCQRQKRGKKKERKRKQLSLQRHKSRGIKLALVVEESDGGCGGRLVRVVVMMSRGRHHQRRFGGRVPQRRCRRRGSVRGRRRGGRGSRFSRRRRLKAAAIPSTIGAVFAAARFWRRVIVAFKDRWGKQGKEKEKAERLERSKSLLPVVLQVKRARKFSSFRGFSSRDLHSFESFIVLSLRWARTNEQLIFDRLWSLIRFFFSFYRSVPTLRIGSSRSGRRRRRVGCGARKWVWFPPELQQVTREACVEKRSKVLLLAWKRTKDLNSVGDRKLKISYSVDIFSG